MTIEDLMEYSSYIEYDKIKTNFAKNLYKNAAEKFTLEESKKLNLDRRVECDRFGLKLTHCINQFIYYNKIKIIKGKEKDICYWFKKPFDEFVNFIVQLDETYEINREKIDTTIILKNDHVIIMTPNTYRACCKYGANTKWCETERFSLRNFKYYNTGDSRLYYFILVNSDEKYVLYTSQNIDKNHVTDRRGVRLTVADFIKIMIDKCNLTKTEIHLLFNTLKKNLNPKSYDYWVYNYKHSKKMRADYKNTKIGDKIKFVKAGRHFFKNREDNGKTLNPGDVFTVKEIHIASSSTEVKLEETGDLGYELMWFEHLNKPLIEEDNAPDTYVKESSIEGFGLYASKNFVKGDLIIDYNLFPENWYNMKYSDLSEEQIRKNWYVMIDTENCITSDKYSKFSYINHSRNANCFWDVDKRIIVADGDIKRDEELFIDYRLEPRPNRAKFPEWI